jgi:hypothetical protein
VPGTTDGGKLFITGYSQGGFVAMATHRALQAAGMTVTAAAPLSGPYALAAFGDAIVEGEVSLSATTNLAFVVSSYQRAYNNLFTTATDVFNEPYSADIVGLLPSTTPVSELEAANEIPSNDLFSAVPPAAQYANLTPATSPAKLAPAFALGVGPDFLITNSYRLSYLQDAFAAPDGGFPTPTNGLPAANPQNALRKDLKTNDLRTWSPTAPVLLCAGDSDPTVFYLNTQLMTNYWTSVGATYTLLDVDSSPAAGDPYATLKNEFAAVKEALVLASGEATMLDDYHAGLVPPFCLSAAKGFFDAH